jgi:aminoglycoside phosphotransferase (APT) family kinase protein
MNTPPAWVSDAVVEGLVAARPARWGFRHETWIVHGKDGRASVIQRRVDGSDPMSAGMRAVRDLVRAAGLPVPEPIRVVRVEGDVIVVLPYVDGVVAADLLGSDRGATVVGRRCGEIGARLGPVNPAAVPVSGTWASGADLRSVTIARMDRLATALPVVTRRRLFIALERAAHEADAVAPRLVHGDLVPVNILLRDDRLEAVLDLDRMQLAHPLYDAAWFAWVMTFYHPDVAGGAFQAFARAAGLAVRSVADLTWMWPLQLLERLDEAQNEPERTMWLARLAATKGSG